MLYLLVLLGREVYLLGVLVLFLRSLSIVLFDSHRNWRWFGTLLSTTFLWPIALMSPGGREKLMKAIFP